MAQDLVAQDEIGLATYEHVKIEQPFVAASAYGQSAIGHERGLPGSGLVTRGRNRIGRRRLHLLDQQTDLGERKAGQCDVEFEIEGLQLDRKQLMIPPGIQGELVVCDDIGPALSRIEIR